MPTLETCIRMRFMAGVGGELYCIRPIDDQEMLRYISIFCLYNSSVFYCQAYRTITTLLGMLFTRRGLLGYQDAEHRQSCQACPSAAGSTPGKFLARAITKASCHAIGLPGPFGATTQRRCLRRGRTLRSAVAVFVVGCAGLICPRMPCCCGTSLSSASRCRAPLQRRCGAEHGARETNRPD